MRLGTGWITYTDYITGFVHSTPYSEDTKLRIEDDTISSGTITANQWNALERLNQGGERDMMRLYEVSAVDTKKNINYGPVWLVAKTDSRATMKMAKLKDIDLDNDDIEFFTHIVGEWESKKPKEVKIVKEE